MLFLLILTFILTLLFWEWIKMRKVIQVSNQIKCRYPAFPLIGHGIMLIGGGVKIMSALMDFGREAIKHGGLTNMWIGRNYFLVVVDAELIEMISKSCLEKDDIMKIPRKLLGNGSIFAPETAFGVDMGAQKKGGSPLTKAFEKLSILMVERMALPCLHPDWVYRMLPYDGAFYEGKKILCDFVDNIIKVKRDTLKTEGKNTSSKKEIESKEDIKTFLDLLIELSGGEEGYSDLELQEETLVILLAGTDTSAVGASFTTMMLSRHQEVQEKVYQELKEVFGDSDRPLIAEDLPRLKYLEIVVKESLRLYPPVPVVVRKVEANVTLPSGVALVPGCGVMFNIWGVHRNPRYWGEDAEVFRPERFFDAPPSHPTAYMPFSCGPRNCLGYQYAMMSIKTAIASLLRRYRILPATNSDIRLSFDVMMKDADQFTVELESRL